MVLDGPEVIETAGAAVSTVTLSESESSEALPAASVAVAVIADVLSPSAFSLRTVKL